VGISIADEVVVYTSVDEILSSRVFEIVEQSADIEVRAVYDSEATKTTGLYLRILQERSNPRADIFWNSEFSRTILLKNEGMLRAYRSEITASIPSRFRDPRGYWTGFSTRARVVAYNTEAVAEEEVPKSADDLAMEKWKGKIAWANPLFGTTATHCGALFALWDEKVFRSRINVWTSNFRQVAGNGQSAELVARGAVPLALTDTDDVWRLKLKGEPIGMVPFDEAGAGTLLIPNTVAILEGCPHPEAAENFVDALLAPEVEEFLAASTSRQMPVRESVPIPEDLESWRRISVLDLDYETIAKNVDLAMRIVRE
jgi:iron(III) transport system substrate-binding protein